MHLDVRLARGSMEGSVAVHTRHTNLDPLVVDQPGALSHTETTGKLQSDLAGDNAQPCHHRSSSCKAEGRLHSPTTAPVQPCTAAATTPLAPGRSTVTSFALDALARRLESGSLGERPSMATQQTPSASSLLPPLRATARTHHTAPPGLPPRASARVAFWAAHKPGGASGAAPSNQTAGVRHRRVRPSDVAATAAAAAAAATAALAAMGDELGEDGETMAIRGRFTAMESSARDFAAAVGDEVRGDG